MSELPLTHNDPFASANAAAKYYWSLGLEPIPLPAHQKKPRASWKTPVQWTDEEIDRRFSPVGNVGLALGERSNDLIDIDFDWNEASHISMETMEQLPPFGRKSSRYSHRLAKGKLPKGVIHFKIPDKAAHLFEAERLMVLELRGNGHQTMVPPSHHPSGERVEWELEFDEVPEVDVPQLIQDAGLTAFLAVIARAYPQTPGNRDNVCLALTGTLLRAGYEPEEVDALVEKVAWIAGDEEYHKRGTKGAATSERLLAGEDVWGMPALCEHLGIEVMADTLRIWLGVIGSGGGGGGDGSDGVDSDAITLRPGFLPQIVDAAEQALLSSTANVFQRYDLLVHTVRLDVSASEDGVGRDSGALVIRPVTAIWLRDQLGQVARWQKQTQNGMRRSDAPFEVATTLISRVGKWKLPPLRGITQSPTLRADGSILQRPGYDTASGLLYDPGGVAFPDIADDPSREDGLRALLLLSRPFRGFSFATDADRSVLLAAILTALVRGMFPAAPMFLIDAPTAGNGKSLMTETIGIIATGHKPAMMAQARTDEENEKRLASVLMAGDPLIVLDNCGYTIEGDFLCSMLTQEVVQTRVLGKSETRWLPTRCVVIATGNGMSVAGDLTRRALVSVLDAGVEHPELREFDFDPRDEAIAQRPQLVASGLTILRAYISAGRPNPLPKRGSFERWNLIREALVWLDCADPVLSQSRIVADDPKKEVLRDVFHLWRAALGGQSITMKELEKRALEEGQGSLVDLVNELSGNTRRGEFNAKSVGRFLSKHLNRVVAGLVMRAETDPSGIKHYRVVENVQASDGESPPNASPF